MDISISIDAEDIRKANAKLESIPGGAARALTLAIRHTLLHGRTKASRAARERYNVPYGWLLKQIGRPVVHGLSGYLRVSGSKIPLGMIPGMRDVFPGGVTVPILRDSSPATLLHAFARSGKVLARETPETPRYPLKTMFGLSAPQMISQRTQVMPGIREDMKKFLAKDLDEMIRLVLSGEIPV